jgi:nucleoside-diphosphate-sugar epimerase
MLAHAGHDLSLTSRSGATVLPGVATITPDLLQPAAARQLCQGRDVVFHLAGIAHQQAAAVDYQRLNVDASLVLAEAAIACGVETFVYVSSSRAAVGDSTSDHYGRSKFCAETALRERIGTSAMRLAIVRPSLVYGANVKGNLALLARAVRAHLPLPPEMGRRSMIGVEDLCRLLVQVADSGDSSLPTLTVTDGESYSTRRIVTALRVASGRSPGGYTLPVWCWQLGSRLLDLLRGLPAGTHYGKLFHDDVCEDNAAAAVRDWNPRQVFEDVAKDIVLCPTGKGRAA